MVIELCTFYEMAQIEVSLVKQLMIVPENTENPPDYVKKW